MSAPGPLRRAVPALALALLVALMAAVPASAGRVLSVGKATKVTQRVAERDCRRDRHCEASNAANCRREATRRVRCIASIVGTDERGDYQCDRVVLVRLRRGGGVRRAAGERSCFRV